MSFLVPGCPAASFPQKCIDWNRNVLKRELGLAESDIVDIPQLFFLKNFYAEAFFPDMVRALGQGPAGGSAGLPEEALPGPGQAGAEAGGRCGPLQGLFL